MIKEETFTIGSTNFIKHYSDSGFKIRQIETGILYDEANDLVPCRYTYEESDIPIIEEEVENEQTDNNN
jgi:hypothetical protein